MLRIVAFLCGVGMFAAIGLSGPTASAQGPFFGHGQGYRFGTGLNRSSRFFQPSNSVHDRIPYFALHPPVYYSGIVPRPYGISPFAAPAGIRPVEMDVFTAPEPVMVENPYYSQPELASPPISEGETTQILPLGGSDVQIVVNPFVDSNSRLTSTNGR